MTPQRRPPVKRRTVRNKTQEYSKRILGSMIVLWFMGAAFGAVVIVVQILNASYTADLSALLTYIGAPMTGGIVSYLIKSAIENREKVKYSNEQKNYESNYIP